MTDSAGVQVKAYEYASFGETLDESGAASNDRTFTGHIEDPDLGLIYMVARYYDANLGRFISPDSLVPDVNNPQAFNRYSYVNNNPISNTDPTGHFPLHFSYEEIWNDDFQFQGSNYGEGSNYLSYFMNDPHYSFYSFEQNYNSTYGINGIWADSINSGFNLGIDGLFSFHSLLGLTESGNQFAINNNDPFGLSQRSWTIDRWGGQVSAVILGGSLQYMEFKTNCVENSRFVKGYAALGLGFTVGAKISLWTPGEGYLGGTNVFAKEPNPISGINVSGPSGGFLRWSGTLMSATIDFNSFAEMYVFSNSAMIGASFFNFEGQYYVPFGSRWEECDCDKR